MGLLFFGIVKMFHVLFKRFFSGLKQLIAILRDLTPSGFALLEAIPFVDSLLIM